MSLFLDVDPSGEFLTFVQSMMTDIPGDENHVVCLCGASNNGRTTLLNAIDQALPGKVERFNYLKEVDEHVCLIIAKSKKEALYVAKEYVDFGVVYEDNVLPKLNKITVIKCPNTFSNKNYKPDLEEIRKALI